MLNFALGGASPRWSKQTQTNTFCPWCSSARSQIQPAQPIIRPTHLSTRRSGLYRKAWTAQVALAVQRTGGSRPSGSTRYAMMTHEILRLKPFSAASNLRMAKSSVYLGKECGARSHRQGGGCRPSLLDERRNVATPNVPSGGSSCRSCRPGRMAPGERDTRAFPDIGPTCSSSFRASR
jgi:hypothetical protein